MNVRVHPVFGHVVLCAGLASTIACSETTSGSPTNPTAVQQGQPQTIGSGSSSLGAKKRSGASTTQPILDGTFSLASDGGGGITGTYTGTVAIADGIQQASLTLLVTGGSGPFEGASGTLTASGFGHFVDEGDFSLGGGAAVTLKSGQRAVVALTVRGQSSLGCTVAGHIAISQSGDGTLDRVGRVAATLHHEVGNAGCTP